MGRICIMLWEKKHKILFEEPKRILEELRWSTLKIELQELKYEIVEWVHVVQDKV
jgi:hypothetical protein